MTGPGTIPNKCYMFNVTILLYLPHENIVQELYKLFTQFSKVTQYLKLNQFVLFKGDNISPSFRWLLARIIDAMCDRDKKIRVILKTINVLPALALNNSPNP